MYLYNVTPFTVQCWNCFSSHSKTSCIKLQCVTAPLVFCFVLMPNDFTQQNEIKSCALVVNVRFMYCTHLLFIYSHLVFSLCHESFCDIILLIEISEQFGKELRQNIAPKFWGYFKVINKLSVCNHSLISRCHIKMSTLKATKRKSFLWC
jgi:hypothetical protein